MSENETPIDTSASDPVESPEDATRDMPKSAALAAVYEQFEDASFTEQAYASSDVKYAMVSVPVDSWLAFAEAARDGGFDTFVDLAAVDHFADAPRFEVALNLLSLETRDRVIVSTRVPYDAPAVPSLTDVFAGANFYEREAFDLFGIDFPGHPDLTRILLPDDWEGYPLRKDYDVGAVPVEFKAGSEHL